MKAVDRIGKAKRVAGSDCQRLNVSRPVTYRMEEVQDGGHGGGVFGQFFALGEAEDHRLDLFIVEDRAAEDALLRWLGFLRQIADVRVGGYCGTASFFCATNTTAAR
jgi:hypothetical protein